MPLFADDILDSMTIPILKGVAKDCQSRGTASYQWSPG